MFLAVYTDVPYFAGYTAMLHRFVAVLQPKMLDAKNSRFIITCLIHRPHLDFIYEYKN